MDRNASVLYTASIIIALIICIPPHFAFAAQKSQRKDFPAIELQSKLMSFADQFTAEVTEATNQYLFEGEPKSPGRRMAVTAGRLNASTSAVSIAAGKNPEVALLDMIVLVKLHAYTVEDAWMPKLLGSEAQVFLDTFSNLEKKIWKVADGILSDKQVKELNELLKEWRVKHKGKFASVANVRFTAFSEYRHNSTLFEKGEPGGIFKTVNEATREIERTRLLAERAIYLAERQPKLIAWQVEQVFYNLTVTDEAIKLIEGVTNIPESSKSVAERAQNVSNMLGKIVSIIDLSSDESVNRLAGGLSLLSSQVIKNTISEIKFTLFFLAILLLAALLAVSLCYKYLAIRMEQSLLAKSES